LAQAARGGPEARGSLDLPPRLVASFRKQAERQQVQLTDYGIIDGEVLVSFLWKIAGRPEGATVGWQRARPLYVVLDNYSVHHGEAVRAATTALNAAGIYLEYLPSYSPELSGIEPIWQTIKHYELPKRSFTHLGDLKRTVDETLTKRTLALRQAARQKSDRLFPRTP
jgi:transposase